MTNSRLLLAMAMVAGVTLAGADFAGAQGMRESGMRGPGMMQGHRPGMMQDSRDQGTTASDDEDDDGASRGGTSSRARDGDDDGRGYRGGGARAQGGMDRDSMEGDRRDFGPGRRGRGMGYGMGHGMGYDRGAGPHRGAAVCDMMGGGMRHGGRGGMMAGGRGMMGQGMMGGGIGGHGMMGGGGMAGGRMQGDAGAPAGGLFGARVTPMMNLSEADVRAYLDDRLARLGNKRLKLGDVKTEDAAITADIVTLDNSLVQRLKVDRRTGAIEYTE